MIQVLGDPPSSPLLTEAQRADLHRLAQLHGIGLEYYDIWGRRREVPDLGLRALLRAMGVEAGDAAQVRASLQAAEPAPGGAPARPLPPVAVFWQEEPAPTLALEAPVPAESMHWILTEEGGTQHEGRIDGPQIELPRELPLGYHRLELRLEVASAATPAERRLVSSTLLIVAPRRCYLPPRLQEGRRVWGPAVQLYALRSERNWGMGDFTDLADLVQRCGQVGAALVGLNPLHALFPHNPEHASPYSPSSRRFGNVLYIDVEAVPEFAQCARARETVYSPDFQARLRGLRQSELVDYGGVSTAKLEILELLYADFRRRALIEGAPEGGGARAGAFRAFQAAGGAALRLHAMFEALQEHFHGLDPNIHGWSQWPFEYRDPGSKQVAWFLQDHGERVEFYEYLQWLFEEQLDAVGRVSLESQLGIGLYQDLAVSIDRNGAESWSAQDLYAQSASAGCPPDDFNLHGQDWGLLPMLPERLRARAYAPFIAVLRACMRHAGALRIDHVMGLARLFWVPRGDLPDAGAYVAYPFDHLLAIVALESQRNHCMVIGEDLGTVPDEVRDAMERMGMLSYRVLYFSRRADGEFLAPYEFPRDCLATCTTHDLATLAGFWEGRDLEVRRALHLYPNDAMDVQQFEERKRDGARLLSALHREGLLPPEIGHEPHWPLAMTPRLAGAVQEYLARSPAQLLSVQLEDVFGCRDQVNLPGTVDQYPNWRRKLPLPLERWDDDGRFAELARRLAPDRRD